MPLTSKFDHVIVYDYLKINPFSTNVPLTD